MHLFNCIGGQNTDIDNSKQIDREIKHWIKSYNSAIKLLLLGTGESGKTTIIKQMKILHIQGFSASERQEKVRHIHHNIHESIFDIVRHAPLLGIGLLPGSARARDAVLAYGLQGPGEYDEEYFDHVRALWRDPGVRETFGRASEYQLIDSAEYFLDRLDLISAPGYVPGDADILRCRQKTTGIQKIEFKVKVPKSLSGGVQDFWMFDVGGQRGERKKWIQVFEGITAIWFLVGCSDYDQRLREDGAQNRLQESLDVFGDVWQSRFLMEAGVIVFLNKQDLLEKKISRGISIQPHFPRYAAFQYPGDEYTRTRMFIRQMFVDITTTASAPPPRPAPPGTGYARAARRARDLYLHCSTATDSDNVRELFVRVHQLILTTALADVGVY